MNRMILESDCCKCKFDEMRLAEEQATLSGADGWVEISLDRSRINHYRGTDIGPRMEELGSINLRMVKVPLQEEREEILITNLPTETFDHFQIAELYQMRWEIESAYETLKDRLQIENFTGTKPLLLLQDIYSTIYISNLAEDIIRDAEAEMDEKETQKNRISCSSRFMKTLAKIWFQ
jgi:hypothetical protein